MSEDEKKEIEEQDIPRISATLTSPDITRVFRNFERDKSFTEKYIKRTETARLEGSPITTSPRFCIDINDIKIDDDLSNQIEELSDKIREILTPKVNLDKLISVEPTTEQIRTPIAMVDRFNELLKHNVGRRNKRIIENINENMEGVYEPNEHILVTHRETFNNIDNLLLIEEYDIGDLYILSHSNIKIFLTNNPVLVNNFLIVDKKYLRL